MSSMYEARTGSSAASGSHDSAASMVMRGRKPLPPASSIAQTAPAICAFSCDSSSRTNCSTTLRIVLDAEFSSMMHRSRGSVLAEWRVYGSRAVQRCCAHVEGGHAAHERDGGDACKSVGTKHTGKRLHVRKIYQ